MNLHKFSELRKKRLNFPDAESRLQAARVRLQKRLEFYRKQKRQLNFLLFLVFIILVAVGLTAIAYFISYKLADLFLIGIP